MDLIARYMDWSVKDQVIFECIDKGLLGLRTLGWITPEDYEKICYIITLSVAKNNDKIIHMDYNLTKTIQ